MQHPILDKHDVIAWDMDGTLVDGPNSEYFLLYIAAHPEKRHHVVTFRDRAWAAQTWSELRSHGLDARARIRSVENCPEVIHDSYMFHKARGNLYGPRTYEYFNVATHNELTAEQFDDFRQRYPMWKGEKSLQLGATILVDDKPEWVAPGCAHFGIEFLHAFDPVPEFTSRWDQ
jgi:hypothetical protein